MYRNSEEEQREESWPAQPKVDSTYLRSKHVPPRAMLGQHVTWELIRSENSQAHTQTYRFFWGNLV